MDDTLHRAYDLGSWDDGQAAPNDDHVISWALFTNTSPPTSVNDSDLSLFDGNLTSNGPYERGAGHQHSRVVSGVIRATAFYLMPGIIGLGILGNTLSAYVFYSSAQLRNITASIYLITLSVCDSVFLLTLLGPWLEGIDVNVYNEDGPCQILHFLTNFSSILSPWLVLSFTVERFIAVKYPFQRSVICTKKRAKMVVCSLIVASGLLNSYAPVLFHSTRDPQMGNATICTFRQEYTHLADAINVVDLVAALVVPCSLIITFNVQISRAIGVSKRNSSDNAGSDENNVSHPPPPL
jgi:hypothetical protein